MVRAVGEGCCGWSVVPWDERWTSGGRRGGWVVEASGRGVLTEGGRRGGRVQWSSAVGGGAVEGKVVGRRGRYAGLRMATARSFVVGGGAVRSGGGCGGG